MASLQPVDPVAAGGRGVCSMIDDRDPALGPTLFYVLFNRDTSCGYWEHRGLLCKGRG